MTTTQNHDALYRSGLLAASSAIIAEMLPLADGDDDTVGARLLAVKALARAHQRVLTLIRASADSDFPPQEAPA